MNHGIHIREVLNDIETSIDVQLIEIDDIYIWPFLKICLFFENSGSESQHKNTFLNKILNIINRVILLILPIFYNLTYRILDGSHSEKLGIVDVLFVSDSINRRIKNENGEYIDIFTDFISHDLNQGGIKNLSLERSSMSPLALPRAGRSVIISSELQVAAILSKLTKTKHYKNNLEPILQQIRDRLSQNGLRSNSVTNKQIDLHMSYLRNVSFVYEKKILLTNPQAIVQFDWYSRSSFALTLAAKKMNIPIIDCQHGVQGPLHPAYSMWKKPLSPNTISLFPDIFICWSEDDKKNIQSWLPNSAEKVFSAENTLMAKALAGKLPPPSKEVDLFLKSTERYRKVLLTLQPLFFPDKNISQQLQILENIDSVFVYIRLHPAMKKQTPELQKIFSSNFRNLNYEIEKSTNTALPIMLANTDIHITHSSSVVIEANDFGVPSIILGGELGETYYRKYLEDGFSKSGIQDKSSILSFQKRIPTGSEGRPVAKVIIDILQKVKSRKS